MLITWRKILIGMAVLTALSTPAASLPQIGGLKLVTTLPNSNLIKTANKSALVTEIVVLGTQRIEIETVRSYMLIKDGEAITSELVDESLKALFATGLFADVVIRKEGSALVVNVVENPIINQIAFEGNRYLKKDALEKEVQLRPRIVFTRTRVQNDVKRLLDLYRRVGRFAANVEPKVIQLEQNRVDLIFEIIEGPPTGIKSISFIGNKHFSDRALKGVIQTKESRWYRYFSSSDSYDPDRLTFDRELLRRHYLKKGYPDFRVLSSVAELTDNRKDFFVTLTIEEGERYKFGESNILSKIADLNGEQFIDKIQFKDQDWYNSELIDDTVIGITEGVGNLGYGFVNVLALTKKDRTNRTMELTFEIGEAPRVFVEKIDIRGNVRTLDRVIRREFRLVEGDLFNASKLRRSRTRIRNLGFFEKVTVGTAIGSSPDKTIVELDVEEQSTGELSIGGGYSTSKGPLGDISIRERNLLGKGQQLSASLQISGVSQEFDITFTEPNFMERNFLASVDVFHNTEDNLSDSSFKSKKAGFGARMGYEFNEDLSQSLRYSGRRETIEDVKDTASQVIKNQAGSVYTSLIGQSLVFDKRNSRIDPTDGYSIILANELAGLGGTERYLRTTIDGGYYYPLTDKIIGGLTGRIGYIAGIGENIRVNDRFFLGGDNLRGFEARGVGPRDSLTQDSLGGNAILSASAELSFPIGLPKEFGVLGATFADIGTLTDVDDNGNQIIDQGSLRSSIGVGLSWRSPAGPFRVEFSYPILKESSDKTETFRFDFGTRF